MPNVCVVYNERERGGHPLYLAAGICLRARATARTDPLSPFFRIFSNNLLEGEKETPLTNDLD